ncbi:uncharacterized protein [Anabrus simplex]|uniref:uncharacterized protein isoform X1 n=1 Tax=Anabrus simplex TaxID=316456 RepID=UPI0035A3654B
MSRSLVIILVALCLALVLGFSAQQRSQAVSQRFWRDLGTRPVRKLLAVAEFPAFINERQAVESETGEGESVTDRTKRSPDDDDEAESGGGIGAIFRRLMRDLVSWLGSLFGLRPSSASGQSSISMSSEGVTTAPDAEEMAASDS